MCYRGWITAAPYMPFIQLWSRTCNIMNAPFEVIWSNYHHHHHHHHHHHMVGKEGWPMRGRDLVMWSEDQWEASKKITWKGDIRHTDMLTLWPTRPRGPSWWRKKKKYNFLFLSSKKILQKNKKKANVMKEKKIKL